MKIRMKATVIGAFAALLACSSAMAQSKAPAPSEPEKRRGAVAERIHESLEKARAELARAQELEFPNISFQPANEFEFELPEVPAIPEFSFEMPEIPEFNFEIPEIPVLAEMSFEMPELAEIPELSFEMPVMPELAPMAEFHFEHEPVSAFEFHAPGLVLPEPIGGLSQFGKLTDAEWLRVRALRSLGRRDRGDLFPELEKVLRNDKSAAVRYEAVQHLRKHLRSDAGIDLLGYAARQDAHVIVRKRAIRLLGKSKHPRATAILEEIVRGKDN